MSDVKNSIVTSISNYLFNLQYLARVSDATQKSIMLLIISDKVYDWANWIGLPQTEIEKLKSFRKCIIQSNTDLVDVVTRTNDFYKNVNIPQTIYTWQRVYDDFNVHTVDSIPVTSTILYGRLYNRYAVLDSRGIAPTGWHVPSYDEWQTLVDYAGGTSVAADALREVGTTHWISNNQATTNSTGFTALPAGNYNAFYQTYNGFETMSYYWTTLVNGSNYPPIFFFGTSSGILNYAENVQDGLSVRLVRDSNNVATSATDYDGNIYASVTIGTQTWLLQNLATTHYNNGDPILQDFTGTVGAYANPNGNASWVITTSQPIT